MLVLHTHKKPGLVWEKVNPFPTAKFGLVQVQSICIRQIHVANLMISIFGRVENIV